MKALAGAGWRLVTTGVSYLERDTPMLTREVERTLKEMVGEREKAGKG